MMSSKCSFRARALDATKMMPIYHSEEIPDLPDFAVNRAVPQMPTGMEKEEESELHLQLAMSAQQTFGHTGDLAIPTPQVYPLDEKAYDKLYPSTFKLPKQLIFMQPLLAGLDDDTPDYDLDSEDENWLSSQNIELTHLQFETIIDRLEKASGHQVVQIKEAKLLLRQDDDILTAVYDYWLNKRLKLNSIPLIPQIKTEKRDGSNSANPYVAFRRRTEKMQTRKNRKNDEASYEKMLKIKRDLKKSARLLQMIKTRENLKREQLQLTLKVFEKRIQAGDWTGAIVNETLHQIARQKQHQQQLAREALYGNKHEGRNNGYASNVTSQQIREMKAKHRKNVQGQRISSSSHKRTKDHQREHSTNGSAIASRELTGAHNISSLITTGDIALRPELMLSSEDDEEEAMSSGTEDPQDIDMSQEPDGIFTFRRKRNVSYLAPLPLEMPVPLEDEEEETPTLQARLRRVPTDEVPPNLQYRLLTLQTESDESDLSGLEDLEPLPSEEPNGDEDHFMTMHSNRVRTLNAMPRPASEHHRRRRKDNYLTFFGRRRIGRGGRIVFDRMPNSPE